MSEIIYEVEKIEFEKNEMKNNMKRMQTYTKMLKKITETKMKKLREEQQI